MLRMKNLDLFVCINAWVLGSATNCDVGVSLGTLRI